MFQKTNLQNPKQNTISGNKTQNRKGRDRTSFVIGQN